MTAKTMWTQRAVVVGALMFAAMVGLSSPALAQGGHDHGSGDGGGKDGGEKGGKHGGMGEKMQGMMGGMEHAVPGTEQEMCSGHGGMLPHYCEPVYKVSSSVRGVAVDDVKSGGDKAVIVTLRELNANHPGVAQKLVVVAGNGDLVGATIVDAGWKDSKTVQIGVVGDRTIYDHPKAHVHVFPLTSN